LVETLASERNNVAGGRPEAFDPAAPRGHLIGRARGVPLALGPISPVAASSDNTRID
jgi:hypothetical protein